MFGKWFNETCSASSVTLLAAAAVVTGMALAAAPARASVADITNLGTLGGPTSHGRAVNNAGQVAGYSATPGRIHPLHAFLYTGAAMTDLGTLNGSLSSRGYGINASGQVAGSSGSRAFLYTGTPGSGGHMDDLGALGGGVSHGYAVNDAGQVAGYSNIDSTHNRAFRYTGTPGSGGHMDNLGTLGGASSFGFAINASGQVAGYSNVTGGTTHAFRYTGSPTAGGHMDDLGTLGGFTAALAINDAGQVAGYSTTTSGDTRAFLYTGTPGSGGHMDNLGTLGGNSSFGHAIDPWGHVAGASEIAGGDLRAFFYTGSPTASGHMIDLDAWLDANNPADGANWTLNDVYGISDNGWMTGFGQYNDGPAGLPDGTRAYRLNASTLVPEPTSLALLGLGGVMLLPFRGRRREEA